VLDAGRPQAAWESAGAAAGQLSRLSWPLIGLVVLCCVGHYLATAVASRAAAGVPFQWGELLRVQLAVSTANRLTPAGLGGSALLARYFSRRGVDVASAVGSVAALALLGGLADTLVLAGLVLICALTGVTLQSHLLHINVLARLQAHWPWILGAAVATGSVWLTALVIVRSRRTHERRHGLRRALRSAHEIVRHPARLAQLMVASGMTTLVLGCAFAISAQVVPGPPPTWNFAELAAGFMAGSAAGAVFPTPSGLVSTEIALAAILTSAGLPFVQAIWAVVIFRVITFWLPAIAGVFTGRLLRKAGAL
jgi:uncharacterized membrane protein YbhN (UPF0104 family)